MKNFILAGVLMLFASAFNCADAQPSAPVAGEDYIEIQNGVPLEPADDKVVVEEFFNYICPGCNAFEPLFAAWKAQLPPYVKVVYVPAAFRADFVPYARAYYAAQTYDLVEETHASVYDAIHRAHTLPAEGDEPDEEAIAAFYSEYGVDADEFLGVMRSFGVDSKIRRATQHMQRCRVSGTPSIVVNGRYLVRGSSYADMLRTASYLVEKAHAG